MTDAEAERDERRWKEREQLLALLCQKPPVNLWMLIHSRSASCACKRVNAAEAWTCERRHIAQKPTTTRPAFQTQHCRWWWISHMYTHWPYHKHTHTVLAVASHICSIRAVKACTSHSYMQKSLQSFVKYTSADAFHAHIFINTHIYKCKSCLLNTVYNDTHTLTHRLNIF